MTSMLVAAKASSDGLTQTQVILAVVSAAAAWLGLALGIFNAATSRQSLRIARQQEQRKAPRTDIYLADTFDLRSAHDGDRRLIGFSLRIANLSDAPNTMISADLRVTYTDASQLVSTVKIDPVLSRTVNLPGLGELPTMRVPCRLGPRESEAGWLVFELADALFEGRSIESYEIVLGDSYQNQVQQRCSTLREISSGEA